jgi:hypothetical protein
MRQTLIRACACLLSLAATRPVHASEYEADIASRPLLVSAATDGNAVSTAVMADVQLTALDDEFEIRIGGRTLPARIVERRQEGDATVVRFYAGESPYLSTATRSGDSLAAWIETPVGAYCLQPSREGEHHLVGVGGAGFECQAESTHAEGGVDAGRDASGNVRRRRSVGSGRPLEMVELRLGIRYHSRVADAAGGEENAELFIRNAVDALNTALLETGNTGMRVVLVFAKNNAEADDGQSDSRPDYAQPLTFDESIRRFANDPYVQRERFLNQVALVSYWDVIGSGGGVAYVFEGRATPVSGMSVVGWHPTAVRTFIHEIGHGLGLYHERSSYPAARSCAYCYAWENCAAERRDVMSGSTCFTRQYLWYSNLNRIVGGIVTGSEEAHAARALRENRFLIRDSWQQSNPD